MVQGVADKQIECRTSSEYLVYTCWKSISGGPRESNSLLERSESFPRRDAHIGVPETPLGVSQTTTNVSGTLVAGPVTPVDAHILRIGVLVIK